jgi:hypothetical protein
VEPKTPSRFETDVSRSIQDIGLDVVKIKSDISDLCLIALGLLALSIINILLHYHCSELLSEIKEHSTTPSKAVQMEANQ